MSPEWVHNPVDDTYEQCPDHGDSLGYHEDQGEEHEQREHLICTEPGCDYEVWA